MIAKSKYNLFIIKESQDLKLFQIFQKSLKIKNYFIYDISCFTYPNDLDTNGVSCFISDIA